ncbi:DUF862-domain-containing protein [Rhizopus microsporus ATCC 52813]|uniref:DUF862-domain-containing protein n=1 Tax=Rhizopus microsporus ATCC 52813 TaxID=1340429 RepID=A0A2G4SFK0_RHIZD|nr:DUF862-domain-containing protein [Rhizopus microsporus ATCC 52813]PHZ07544.1 DUF862-domain-containing protein [Rhizopus microsporus ATCC 52813]
MAEPVQLYIYDLSQGLAKSMSLALTGKQIDGIWHTSVVVYDQEFYYGQGIMAVPPGSTQHGAPLQKIDIGETYLPLEVVLEYIDSLRSVYTAEKYHLLDFNCNTFSNDLCQFLCGKTIPAHITTLPSEVINTPFGQSILPMIENMFGQSRLRPTTTAAVPPVQAPPAETVNRILQGERPTTETISSLLQGISSAAMSAAPTEKNPIQEVKSAQMMEQLITSYKAVAVMFTSPTCGPCQMIKPKFKELIQEKNSNPQQQIRVLGVLLDMSVAMDAAKYNIRGVPTFHFYLDGKKVAEFSGADYAELKSQVDILLFEAYPPHPHRKLLLKAIINQPNVPILYTNVGKLDVIYGKLNEFIKANNVTLSDTEKKALDETKQVLSKEKKTLNVNEWSELSRTLLDKLNNDQLFPFLDIFKSLLLIQDVSNYYTTNPDQLGRVMDIATQNCETLTRATWIMILRVACNLFADSTLSTTHFTSHLEGATYRSQLTQMLITSLLSDDSQIRQAAASLAYNCSNNVSIERLKKEEGTFIGIAEQEDDDWQVELLSAMVDALTKETDEEIMHRLLAAVGKLLFLAPETSSVGNLLSALDLTNIIETKKKEGVIKSTLLLSLSSDISKIVKQESVNE